MSFLKKHIDGLQGLKDNGISKAAAKALRKEKPLLVDLLRKQQNAGEMSNGSLAPDYSSFTAYLAYKELKASGGRIPRKPKQKNRPWNFEWTGEFHDSFTAHVKQDDSYLIKSSNKGLERDLSTRAGGEIMALTEDANDEIIKEVIEPAIAIEINAELDRLLSKFR